MHAASPEHPPCRSSLRVRRGDAVNYLSVCSGVGSDSLGFDGLGWTCVGVAEVAPFPSAVLAHRYPAVRNFGDFTKIERSDLPPVDLLVGGTPCQSFSVAGNRGGLDDARGNLSLEFARLARRIGARWFLWENVPGVLSADGGLALEIILGTFRQCGYSLAWRILDAQHFGVPQRRRRLFVVGHLGDEWVAPASVLLEPVGLPGDHPARGTAWESAPGSTGTRTPGSGVHRRDQPATGSGTGTRPGSDPSPAVTVALTGNPYADRGDGSDHSRLVVQPATALAPSPSVVAALTGHPYGDQGADHSRLVVQSGLRAHSGGDDGIVGTLLGGGETKRGPRYDHPVVAYPGSMPPPTSGMGHVDGHTGIHDPSAIPGVAGSVMMGSGQRNDPFTQTYLIGHVPDGIRDQPVPVVHPSEYVPDRIMTMTAKWGKGSGGPAGDEHYNLVAHVIGTPDGSPATETAAPAGSVRVRSVHMNQRREARLADEMPALQRESSGTPGQGLPVILITTDDGSVEANPVAPLPASPVPASPAPASRYTAYGVADITGALMAEAHPYGFTGQDAYAGKLIPTFVSVVPSEGGPEGGPEGEVPGDRVPGQLPMPFDLAQITSKLNYSQARPGDMVPPLNTVSQMHVVIDPPAEPPSAMTATGAESPEEVFVVKTSHTGFKGGNVTQGVTYTLSTAGPPAVAWVMRGDAPRRGVAVTPSADASGVVRLRDPGFTVMDNPAPTVDSSAAPMAAPIVSHVLADATGRPRTYSVKVIHQNKANALSVLDYSPSLRAGASHNSHLALVTEVGGDTPAASSTASSTASRTVVIDGNTWTRVTFAHECDDEGSCPHCLVAYGDCPCPGPTDDEMDYCWIDGVMHARRPTVLAVRTAQTGANGIGVAEDVAHTLDGAQGQAIAFSAKDYGGDAGPLSPTLRSGTHDASHANGGVMPAVALTPPPGQDVVTFGTKETNPVIGTIASHLRTNNPVGVLVPDPIAFDAYDSENARPGAVANPLRAGGAEAVSWTASEQSNGFAWERPHYPTLTAAAPTDTSNIQHGIRIGPVVRRLTPLECERLQGLPDSWTAVPYRGKPAADGPRYQAIGNGMAVPVMRWIAQRIAQVDAAFAAPPDHVPDAAGETGMPG